MLGGVILAMSLGGCDGPNLFTANGIPAPPPPSVDARAEVLRYLEQATLLVDDSALLRFRWSTPEPRLLLPADLPEREREAFRRGMALIREAGGPRFREVEGPGTPGGNPGPPPGTPVEPEPGTVEVEVFGPLAYRRLDPTRPWSFSRTLVTASPETGITRVDIQLSLELADAVLDRAVLHALGHAIGLMGHPAFPGEAFVMATSPGNAAPPTSFHPWERVAIRFLYSPAVQAGMSRPEIRAAWEGFDFQE